MKVISVEDAVAKIPNGATMVITGLTGCANPDYVLAEIEKEFLETGNPKDLTLIWDNANTDGSGKASDRMGHVGLVKKGMTSHLNLMPKMQKLVDNGEIPVYVMPLGCMSQLYREIGRGSPGLITKIGLGTYVDPRIAGGKGNDACDEDVVEIIEIHGEEYMLYKSFPIDVAVIRGTTIDTKGNMTCEKEAMMTDALVAAEAVKKSGGIVIAQVQGICEHGQLKPEHVFVPGVLIDYAVVSPPEYHSMGLSGPQYDPALAHEYRVPLDSMKPAPMNVRKIIARRAAMELKENNIVNLGFGIPETISAVAAEAGVADQFTMTVECGLIGGVPNGALFGSAYNPDFVIDMTRMMDWYEGGALDIAFLGAAEVDRYGNANVTKFGRTVGPGGFINIAHTAKKVVYCGTLTAGGLKVEADDGELKIVQEGSKIKYVNDVEQISFCGATAIKENQEVIYVTERAVFKLTADGLELIEVAPGIDVETQVLPQVAFPVKISDDLKLMDSAIFKDEPMALDLTK